GIHEPHGVVLEPQCGEGGELLFGRLLVGRFVREPAEDDVWLVRHGKLPGLEWGERVPVAETTLLQPYSQSAGCLPQGGRNFAGLRPPSLARRWHARRRYGIFDLHVHDFSTSG